MSVVDRLKNDIDELVPDLVATRRDLHEHPELAFEEVRTSGIVAARLQKLGLEVQTGIAKTGVTALLRGKGAGKTLAIRADMDALPIHEQNQVEYRSQTDGKMHACGHDGHTSILLAVAEILTRRRDELNGNVKFVFQPAEERIGGAAPMVQEGAMNGVDTIIGLHLISDFQMGRVGVRSGPVFASADSLTMTITGKGGHAASPHEAIDPIVIAAQIIMGLQTLISRETSPFQPSVITFGQINAGTAFNIIPQTAVMNGTMRAFDKKHRDFLIQRIHEVSKGIATAMRGSCEIEFLEGCPPCVNDPAMSELVYQSAVETVGPENVFNDETVLATGSDDMACFLDAVPGCYFVVGSGNREKETDFAHHHPRFNLDEDALPIAVEVMVRSALNYLK